MKQIKPWIVYNSNMKKMHGDHNNLFVLLVKWFAWPTSSRAVKPTCSHLIISWGTFSLWRSGGQQSEQAKQQLGMQVSMEELRLLLPFYSQWPSHRTGAVSETCLCRFRLIDFGSRGSALFSSLLVVFLVDHCCSCPSCPSCPSSLSCCYYCCFWRCRCSVRRTAFVLVLVVELCSIIFSSSSSSSSSSSMFCQQHG